MKAKRVALLTEVKKKKKDEAEIKKIMQHTFSIRRQEVLQEPAIAEFLDRWPALFDVCEVSVKCSNLFYQCLQTFKISILCVVFYRSTLNLCD